MKYLTLSCLVLISISCFSQTDTSSISIADRIAEYKPSKSELISKGRRMLLDEFRTGNMDRVAEIVHYFEREINDKSHVGLWPSEQILLYYWIEEYSNIIDFSNYNPEENNNYNRKIIYPSDNSVFNEIADKSTEDFDFLMERILQQDFSQDAEDFLVLMLKRLLVDDNSKSFSMEQVNKEADKFILDYPNSPMNEVVKKHISYKWTIGDWSYGMYFGGGYTIPSGNMLDYVSSKGALCVSFDIFYKKSALLFNVQSGFGETQQDIPVKSYGYWEKNMSSDLTSVGIGLGFSAFDNIKFRITPFAGVSFGYIYPSGTDLDEELEKFSIGTSVSPMFGLNLTYRFINPNKLSPPNHYSPFQGSFGLNAKITYVPNILRQEGHQYAGNIWYLTIGVNMEFFNLKKK